MEKTLISKVLDGTTAEAYYTILPGRIRLGLTSEFDPLEAPTKQELSSEQKSWCEGTALHSLAVPGETIYLRVNKDGVIYDFPIPPINLGSLEPRLYYEKDTYRFLGTRLRLPGLYVYANALYFHHSQGRPAEIPNLLMSYAGDMTRVIDTDVLRTRLAPGVAALAMGGDTFLKPGQVGLTRSLSTDLLNQIQSKLPEDKAKKLSDRRSKYGDSIISGYEMIVLRNPTTVYGACRRYKVVSVDTPGAAIYMRSPDIDKAGGDYDGDYVFMFDAHDLSGNKIYEHCMTSTGGKVLKTESLNTGSIIANKNGKFRRVDLANLSWVPEKETTIMLEFKEKSIIGKAWYLLVHYMFLAAHYHGNNKIESLKSRYEIIKARALADESSLLYDAFCQFSSKHPDPDWTNAEVYEDWIVLAYRALAEAIFPIYELIFDLRKGDGVPPYKPVEVISGLMGYSSHVDWTGMQQGGVWTDLIHSIYESLPRVVDPRGVSVDLPQALSNYPGFYYLVHKRRGLSAARHFSSVQSLGPYMGDSSTFAQRLLDSLLVGKAI